MVIITLQVLGQALLGFRLSIAQVLVAILTSLVLDAGITLARGGGLKWPASAMLTGNGVALILRAAGTRHGDWWSLDGAQYFALAATVAILSKHLIRPGSRHIYNPSNIGLVLCLLVVGPSHVFPQYLWWGPLGPPVIAAWLVIAIGAAWVLWPLAMGRMVLAFIVPFSLLVALLAATGSCFDAVWRVDSVCGLNYWLAIAASPEVAIFVLFMMSDPRTAPGSSAARVFYGAGTALVAVALTYLQPTEYGVKLSILAALTMVCAVMPVVDSLLARARARARDKPANRRPLRSGESLAGGRPLRARAGTRSGAIAAALLITLFVSGAVVVTSGNQQLIQAERGGGAASVDIPKQ